MIISSSTDKAVISVNDPPAVPAETQTPRQTFESRCYPEAEQTSPEVYSYRNKALSNGSLLS